MAEKLDPKGLVTPEEIAVSNMWEIAAIAEVLERKGLCTKQELYDIIEELRSRNPAALHGKGLVPDSEDTARIESNLIDRVLELIKAVGLKPAQAQELLRRVSVLLDRQGNPAMQLRPGLSVGTAFFPVKASAFSYHDCFLIQENVLGYPGVRREQACLWSVVVDVRLLS